MTYTKDDFNAEINALDGELQSTMIKQAKVLTTTAREDLSKKQFAVPGKKKYPIPDLAHARNALARVSQFGSPSEREQVRSKVYAKYPELKANFKEQHGESPTSKENIKKEEQGDIGKEGSLQKEAMCGSSHGAKKSKSVAMAVRRHAKKKTAGIPANIAKSPKTSTAEIKKVLNVQQAMKSQKTAAEQPGPLTATLGQKGEAVGAAAGLLAGLAIGGLKGKGVGAAIGGIGGALGGAALGRIGGGTAEIMMRPTEAGPYKIKKGEFIINGEKIAAGEESAAKEEGLTTYAGDSAEHDQDAARNNLQSRPETRTSEHNQQVANPPTTTDKVVKEGQYGMYGAGGPMDPRVAYMMQMMAAQQRRKPTTGEKVKGWLQENPEAYTLGGAALGALGGGALGHYTGKPGATVGGAGLGAALGAAGGHSYSKRASEEPVEFEINGEKIAAKSLKPGEVSKKDLKTVYEKMVRTSKSPVRRTFTWDVGDLVGRKKGKEEYKPGTMVAMRVAHPAYRRKTAQMIPGSPMMQGGDVRYTVGPTPEDVAEYLRTQQAGQRIGAITGAGLGAAGGGTLGHIGGGALAKGLGAGATGEAAGEILGTLLGAGAGGLAGGRIGAPVGEAIGGAVGEATTPAAQMETPYMSPARSEQVARRLAMAAMLRGGKTPTTAISPG